MDFDETEIYPIEDGEHVAALLLIDEICEKSTSEKVQSIGKTVSVYRNNKKKPVITLPAK